MNERYNHEGHEVREDHDRHRDFASFVNVVVVVKGSFAGHRIFGYDRGWADAWLT